MGLRAVAPYPITDNQAAADYARDLQMRLKRAKDCLNAAKGRQKQQADKKRSPVEYMEGQMVMLSSKNIHMKGPGSKKLLPKYIGPYKVTKLAGPAAVTLDLPRAMKCFNTFHVSLVKPYKSATTNDTANTPAIYNPPPLLVQDGNAYWAVERIVQHRDRAVGTSGRTVREYLVSWEGYDSTNDTWEPEKTLLESSAVEAEINAYMAGVDALSTRRTRKKALE